VGLLNRDGDIQIVAMFLHLIFLIVRSPASGPCPMVFETVHRQSLVNTESLSGLATERRSCIFKAHFLWCLVRDICGPSQSQPPLHSMQIRSIPERSCPHLRTHTQVPARHSGEFLSSYQDKGHDRRNSSEQCILH
jgi:hypothetical protein